LLSVQVCAGQYTQKGYQHGRYDRFPKADFLFHKPIVVVSSAAKVWKNFVKTKKELFK
jgi:hypothetical protein